MIAYHICHEAVAANIIRVAWEDTKSNLADLLTKLHPKPTQDRLIGGFMY